jgi:hypothetical protein
LLSKAIRIVLALAFVPCIVEAQSTVENQRLRVELIGLKRWTIAMIQDSLAKYSPRDSLLTHSCAEILRDKLKFADASVSVFPKGQLGLTKDLVVVSVIEPQDSALIEYRGEFLDTLPRRPEWTEAWRVIEKSSDAFQAAVQRSDFLQMPLASISADERVGPALKLREFLDAHRRESDRTLALKTLESDGNWENRIVAVVMLRSFASHDSSWWTLLETLRDPNGRVGATAGQVLSGMARGQARRVDWRPKSTTLRKLLNGTSLFTYNSVLNVLASTRVDQSMASVLLGGGGEMVMAKLRSGSSDDNATALRFLQQISARDWNRTDPNWTTWMSSLKRGR